MSGGKLVKAQDLYGADYEIEADKLEWSVHIYGIAVKGNKAMIVPQFDGYDWPGGTIEMGEDHLDALRREFKEETGLVARPVKLLNIWTSFFRHHKREEYRQSLLIYYLVEAEDGEISTEGFDEDERDYAQEARWLSLDEIRQMRHACSIDIAEDLLKFAEEAIKTSTAPPPNL